MQPYRYIAAAIILLQIFLAGSAWSQSIEWKSAGALSDLIPPPAKPAGCSPAEQLSSRDSPSLLSTATTISFDLPTDERTSLWVIDTNGQMIGTLIDGRLRAGNHHVRLDATGLPAGAYRYLLRMGMKVATGTFTVTR
ncbi:MAG: hypothetical protein ABIR47_00225 [Candidatus Kapaibacterium sp.]